MTTEVVWQDVECGAYSADLEPWERLASASSGPVLELGSGTGRVSLHLARRGHEVWAIDREEAFVEAIEERALAEGLAVRAVHAHAERLELGREFGLAIAAMQVIQMVGDEAGRAPVLRRAAAHVRPGGRFAAAILDGVPRDAEGSPAPLPDVREVDGWVYSSLPVEIAAEDRRLELRRRRQAVTPAGDLCESEHTESLWVLEAADLEAEGEKAGLRAADRIPVPGVDGYVGSVIVVLEAP
jgi:SAM-dependent methyltransferase